MHSLQADPCQRSSRHLEVVSFSLVGAGGAWHSCGWWGGAPQVKLQLVGFDAVLLVEGRELAYVKLLDVDALVSAAAPGAPASPAATRLSVAVTAGDIALRDLQVGTAAAKTCFRTCSMDLISRFVCANWQRLK